MSQQTRSRKAQVTKRQPGMSGTNSWAQEAEISRLRQADLSSGPATNRNKYEDKPMPPLPRPGRDLSPPGPGEQGYIQPAIPLKHSGPPGNEGGIEHSPVSSQGLFSGNTAVSEFRRKFIDTKHNINTEIADGITMSVSAVTSPKTPPTPETHTQASGGRNINQTRRETPPSSAPANTNVPDPYRASGTPGRQTNSTPVPTRRFLRENNIPTSVLTKAAVDLPRFNSDDSDIGSEEDEKPEGLIVGDGNLKPTKTGTYGSLKEVQIVEGKAIHKVASLAGVIENAEPSPSAAIEQHHPGSTSASLKRDVHHQEGTMLQPTAYSPSVYGGVWENDPHVGDTLPPFSPMRPLPEQNPGPMRGRSPNFQAGAAYAGPASLTPNFAPSQSNGFAPSNDSTNTWSPMNGMHFQDAVPPLFSNGHANNSVPPPPPTFRDFIPGPGPVSAELNRVELNIHHHIDTCFGSLSRLVTDKIDQSLDQVIRRLEDGEQKNEKQFKIVKNGIKELQENVHLLHRDIGEVKGAEERRSNSLEGTETKLNSVMTDVGQLDEKFEKLRMEVTNLPNMSGGDEKGLVAMENKLREVVGKVDRLVEHMTMEIRSSGVSPRRAQSASHPSPTYYGQRQQYHSGTSNSSVGPRNSNTSNRGRRSNNSAGGASGAADGRNARREHYAEMGHSIGEAPDIRQHPAYQQHTYDANGHPVSMASDGSMYQPPGFLSRDTAVWYQQAYGS